VRAAGAHLELVRVPDHVLPSELALTAAPAQHILTSVRRWHLANPPDTAWTDEDIRADDAALAAQV
jgi:hypothetical protein